MENLNEKITFLFFFVALGLPTRLLRLLAQTVVAKKGHNKKLARKGKGLALKGKKQSTDDIHFMRICGLSLAG